MSILGFALWKYSKQIVDLFNSSINAIEEWGNLNKLRELRNGLKLIKFSNLNPTNSAKSQGSQDSSALPLTEEAAVGR